MVRSYSILFVSAVILTGTAATAGDTGFVGVAPLTEVIVGEPQDTYGTASLTVHVVGSFEFQPRLTGNALMANIGIDRFSTSPGASVSATDLAAERRADRTHRAACL